MKLQHFSGVCECFHLANCRNQNMCFEFSWFRFIFLILLTFYSILYLTCDVENTKKSSATRESTFATTNLISWSCFHVRSDSYYKPIIRYKNKSIEGKYFFLSDVRTVFHIVVHSNNWLKFMEWSFQNSINIFR